MGHYEISSWTPIATKYQGREEARYDLGVGLTTDGARVFGLMYQGEMTSMAFYLKDGGHPYALSAGEVMQVVEQHGEWRFHCGGSGITATAADMRDAFERLGLIA